ncbi:MAG: anti-sigma factor [Lewinellaceae bacterium]|nr:anti-sigma factor [Lewinellaceae bacterium]
MDIQSFIQSGLLEAYALNQCSPEERAEVERMAAAHPEVRAEIDAIEQTLEQVALVNAVPPPAGLKDQILQQVRADRSGGGTPPGNKGRLPWITALPWVAVLALGLLAVWQAREKNSLNERVATLQTRVADCDTRAQQQAGMQDVIALLRDSDTRAIRLSDAAAGADAKVTATVWHNPARAETMLDINSLPAPESGKYFQFWAIVAGKPVSMGMVNLRGADAFQALPFIQNAEAFAISAENKPSGSPMPTLVVLVGKV